MRFLKDNAFLAATTLIVIAVAVVCLLLTRSFGSQAEEFAKQRKDLSASLASLLGGEPVNSRVLQAYEQYAAAVEHERAKVEDEFVRYNRRNYKVMTFTKGDTKQKVPAFPIDRDLYEKEGWRLLFPERYREELAALLQSMDPVKMPTPEEIAREAEQIRMRMAPPGTESGAGMGTARPTPVAPATPGGASPLPPRIPGGATLPPRIPAEAPMPRVPRGAPAPPRIPAEAPMPRIPGGAPMVPRIPSAPPAAPRVPGAPVPPGGVTGAGGVPATAQHQAIINLAWERARAGHIYADEESLYSPLVAVRTDYSDFDLWLAQVSLWVQQDIVSAIRRTNAEALAKAPPGTRGVPASAVKRLVRTNVRGYVVSAATGGGGMAGMGAGGLGGMPAAPTRAMLQYLGRGTGSQNVPQLTGRATNKLYDVVHYEFTVIIPFRHLLTLYRNLMQQNFHTILSVQINAPTETARGLQGAGAFGSGTRFPFDFGTDPVVEATIVGELLLLSDWTRGRWDPQAKDWAKGYPPLMPRAFLDQLFSRAPDALRPEDRDRLGVGAAVAVPGAPAPGVPRVPGVPGVPAPPGARPGVPMPRGGVPMPRGGPPMPHRGAPMPPGAHRRPPG